MREKTLKNVYKKHWKMREKTLKNVYKKHWKMRKKTLKDAEKKHWQMREKTLKKREKNIEKSTKKILKNAWKKQWNVCEMCPSFSGAEMRNGALSNEFLGINLLNFHMFYCGISVNFTKFFSSSSHVISAEIHALRSLQWRGSFWALFWRFRCCVVCCRWHALRRDFCWSFKLRWELRSFMSCSEISAPIIEGKVGSSEGKDVVGWMGKDDGTDSNSSIVPNATIEGNNSIWGV